MFTDDQIKRMVDRFLNWRLPEPWKPDSGISYKHPNFAHAPADHDWPTGTNLFDANQADAMVRYMTEGMPSSSLEECAAIVQAEVNFWAECVDKAGEHPSADSCFHRYKTALHILEKIKALKPATPPAGVSKDAVIEECARVMESPMFDDDVAANQIRALKSTPSHTELPATGAAQDWDQLDDEAILILTSVHKAAGLSKTGDVLINGGELSGGIQQGLALQAIKRALRRSRPSPAPTVEVRDLTPRREASQTINLKDLGFTLATSPEALAEIDTMERERVLASLRSRNIIFD